MALRKHPRFAAQLPVYFSGKKISGRGTLVQISIAGCCVSSDPIPPYPSVLTLSIEFHGNDPDLKIKAVVRWASETEFGAEFLEIGKAELERLQALVETYE